MATNATTLWQQWQPLHNIVDEFRTGHYGSLDLTRRDDLRYLIAVTVGFIFLMSRLMKLIHGVKMVGGLVGLRPPLDPFVPPGAFLPSGWLNPRNYYFWYRHFGVFERFGSETVSTVPWLFGTPTITTSNIEVTRQILANGYPKNDFIKPEFARKPLQLWGMNILTADGDLWRKHRRIIGAAFTNSLYRYVWDKTVNTYAEINEIEGWKGKNTVDIPSAQTYTFKLTLLNIAHCGFGFTDFHWTEPPKATDGSMSIQQSLRVIADKYLVAGLMPPWILNLPFKSFREIRLAKDQMTKFIAEQIDSRRKMSDGGGDVGKDCFSLLVKANSDEASKHRMSDEELIGNFYTMLFTGHETTAHTLAATFAHLSIHPKVQQETYEHIISVIGHNRSPTFDDFGKLDKVLALFYEVLRLYPSAYFIYREAACDTTLTVPTTLNGNETRTIPIAKGTRINLDLSGAQYNPRYIKDPYEFRPSRWYGVSDVSESFIGFGIGPRACVGRRFSLFEAVAFLTLLIRDWEVHPLLQKGQTLENWKSKVFDVNLLILLGIKNVPVQLKRRPAPAS